MDSSRSCRRLLVEWTVGPDGQLTPWWVEEAKRWDLRAPETVRLVPA